MELGEFNEREREKKKTEINTDICDGMVHEKMCKSKTKWQRMKNDAI